MKRPTPSRHAPLGSKDRQILRIVKYSFFAGLISGVILSGLLPSLPDGARWAARKAGIIAPLAYEVEPDMASAPVVYEGGDKPRVLLSAGDSVEYLIALDRIHDLPAAKRVTKADPALVEAGLVRGGVR